MDASIEAPFGSEVIEVSKVGVMVSGLIRLAVAGIALTASTMAVIRRTANTLE